ncbi:MAG: hypothetical protein PVG63_05840, partial [Anaerolineales bacterium]
MKVDRDYQSMLLTNAELSVLLERFRDPANPLALRPVTTFDDSLKSEVIIDFDTMHKDLHETYYAAINVIGDPVQLVDMIYTVAHHSLPRVLMAWPANPDGGIGLLSASPGGAALSLRPVEEVFDSITQALVLKREFSQDDINLHVDSETMIVLIAAMEAARFNANKIPGDDENKHYQFAPDQVLARLSEAGKDDLRWPLNLIEKLGSHLQLPNLDGVEVERCLMTWVEAGVLEQISDENSHGKAMYRFIHSGKRLVTDWATEMSKIGLSISIRLDEFEAVDEEVWLLVRTKRRLWLVCF